MRGAEGGKTGLNGGESESETWGKLARPEGFEPPTFGLEGRSLRGIHSEFSSLPKCVPNGSTRASAWPSATDASVSMPTWASVV
jgi:hypothetical protein